MIALAFPLALMATAASPHEEAPSLRARPHDMHLTYSRVVVNGARIVARVRVFQDDLELALRQLSGRPDIVVKAAPSVDSLFAAYWQRTSRVTADGVALQGRVRRSGADSSDTEARMWWYEVEMTARKPVQQLSIHVGLFFDRFRDQRNIVSLVRMPGGERASIYFAPGDEKEVLVKW